MSQLLKTERRLKRRFERLAVLIDQHKQESKRLSARALQSKDLLSPPGGVGYILVSAGGCGIRKLASHSLLRPPPSPVL
jgi:hypothetical protein